MKLLALTAIAAVTLLIAVTPVLWSHSPQNQNPVIGQIQQIESLQNTVEGMAKACFTEPPERCRLSNLQPSPIRPQPVVEYVAAAIPN